MLELDTPHGTARAHLHPAAEPRAALVLGHGAGGGVTAPDLVAATAAALAADVSVALVEQPYRVAGPAFAGAGRAARHRLDRGRRAARATARWTACRSSPAAARPARGSPAARPRRPVPSGVVCLAFPLRPPGRPDAPSRLPELEAVTVPTARGPGPGRSVRDPTSVGAANGRPRAGQPQPPQRQAGDRGGPGLAFAAALTMRTYVRVTTGDDPARRPGRVLRVRRAAGRAEAAGAAGARRHGGRARGELRGKGVRRPDGDERAPGAAALS